MDINQVKKINNNLCKTPRLAILLDAKVENGEAYFTDLDNFVTIPTTWENGLYCRSNIPTQKEHSQSTQNIEDFPSFKEDGKAKYVCSMAEINENITDFCSKDEWRGAILGVYLDANENKAVATDGQKLYYQHIKVSNSIIVPKTFILLSKSLECNGDVFVSKKYVITESNGIKIKSKILELPYPNYMCIIPQNTKSVEVQEHKDMLMSAIKTILPFSNPKTKLIKFDGNYITTRNFDTNKLVKVNIGIQIFPFPIGFNASYFITCLNIAQGAFYVPDTNIRGITIKDKNTCILLMPLRILDEENIPLENYTELYPETIKPKQKKPNWKGMYEDLLKENKELKNALRKANIEVIVNKPSRIKVTTIYTNKAEKVCYI